MTKATKAKVQKKVATKMKKAMAIIPPLKSIAGGEGENIVISNRNVTNQLSEAMKVLSSSRAMRCEVALRAFQLCKEVDALAVSSRTAIVDIMKANAKNPDDLDGKFEVHSQEKYLADIEEFLNKTITTKIRKFVTADFQDVGLSAVDYASLEFLFSDSI